MTPPSTAWVSVSPPPDPSDVHLSPLAMRRITESRALDRVADVIDAATSTSHDATTAAIRSLVPWVVTWMHRIPEILSVFPPSLPATVRTLRTQGLSALERTVVEEWGRGRSLTVTHHRTLGRSASSRGGERTRQLSSFRLRARLKRYDVLLIAFQPNSVRALLPLAEELRRRDHSCAIVPLGSDAPSLDALARTELDVLPLERFVPWTLPFEMPMALRRLNSALASESLASFLASTELLPHGFPAQAAARLVARLARRRFLGAWVKARALERLGQKFESRAWLFSSDHALVSRVEVPSSPKRILLLQGVIPPVPRVTQNLPVDLALVGSALDLAYPEHSGIAPSRVKIVGYPEHARLRGMDRTHSRSSLRSRLGLDEDARVVLFTSQYPTDLFPDWARRRNIAEFLTCAARRTDVHFVVKPHPRLEALDEECLEGATENVHVAPKDLSTLEAIHGADALITYWSTTALEATILDVPLFQLNATGLADYYPLSEAWGLSTSRSGEELAAKLAALDSAIETGAARARQRQFLEDNHIPDSTLAAERSVDEVERLLETSPLTL